MKRLFAATATAALLATGAFAATQDEAATINQYLPEVDVSTLSDEQVAALLTIAHGGDSESEKALKMEGILR